jgi:hypothetical protein
MFFLSCLYTQFALPEFLAGGQGQVRKSHVDSLLKRIRKLQ